MKRSICLALITQLLITPIIYAALENDPLPPTSVYNLKVALEDQNGNTLGLDHHRGHPVLITMFYASCPHVCPLLISTIKVTETLLTESERKQLRVLAISINPEIDTPDILLETLQRHGVDTSRWTMARPEPDDLRAISSVLRVKYKKLPDGEFNHTTSIILFDSDGSPVARTEQLGRQDPAFVEAIKEALD